MTIYFVGTPGTGKSAIAREVASVLNYRVLEINDIVNDQSFFVGYDVFRDSLIIDEPLVCDYLLPILEKDRQVCLCGPILELPPQLFDLVIVVKCNPGILRKRLAARGYDIKKIEENIEAEIMEIIAEEARILYSGNCPIYESDTSNCTPTQAAELVAKKLKSRKL